MKWLLYNFYTHLYVSLSICQSVSVIYLSVSQSVCLSVSPICLSVSIMYLSFCQSVLSVSLSVSQSASSICLSLCQSVSSIYQSVSQYYLSVSVSQYHLFICLSVHPCIHLCLSKSISLAVCPSIYCHNYVTLHNNTVITLWWCYMLCYHNVITVW